MSNPRVCPQPGPRGPGPDCPLFEIAAFRRRVGAEAASHLNLASLIAAEGSRPGLRPTAPPTRPLPKADPLLLGQAVAGEPQAVPANQKGAPHA